MSRALVVDDDLGFRLALAEVLRLEGYTTITASTCREALLELAKDSVDLLFVDVNLPDGSGLDLLPRPASPTVIVTGEPSLTRERRLHEEIGRLRAEVGALQSGGRRL